MSLFDDLSTPLGQLTPRGAFRLCRSLGRLSRWWLRPEVLGLAGQFDPSYPEWTNPQAPSPPETLGDCLMVFQGADLPLLRPAFLLPVCWRPSRGHSPHLPPEVTALANQVIADVRGELRKFGDWGLHPSDCLGLERNPLDGGLRLPCDSGWAALAAGLIARTEGLLPRGRIWASGAWNRFGLADIDGLDDKLSLAVEWGATDFFVPVWRQQEARLWVAENAPDRMTIGPLAAHARPDPLLTLDAYLADATVPPEGPGDEGGVGLTPFERYRNYYLHQPASEESQNYYWRCLLPAIIHRCQEKYHQNSLSRPFAHVVTIVSPSNELAVLAPQVVGAKRCLLLHTSDMRTAADVCAGQLKGVTCQLGSFSEGPNMETAIKSAVADFLRDVRAGEVAFDLTPGTKMMSYSLSRAARPGDWLFCLRAEYLPQRCPDGRPYPGTEEPELRRVEFRESADQARNGV